MVNAVRDALGVGIGSELVAEILQLTAQRLVVLDDAVVHDGQAVARDMRMSIAFGRRAVRCPARVGDAERRLEGIGVECGLEFGDLALAALAAHGAVVQNRESCRIIATVFQPPQALHEDGDDVAIRDGADDAAHVVIMFRTTA